VPPFLFDQFSSALEWIIQKKFYIPKVIRSFDDFFIAAAPPCTHCATAVYNVLHLFTELDIPIAPGKTFLPSTSLEFMGILLDSSMMEARFPQDKLARNKQALHQWSLTK